MTPDASSADAVAQLKKQLDGLSQEVSALAATQKRARHVRLALGLLAFALCIAIVVSFYQLANGMVQPDNIEKLRKAAENRLQKRSDDYMRQVQTLVDKSSPVISEAFSKQVKKDLPKYLQIMEVERDQFADELQKDLAKKMTKKYEQEIAKHQALLQKEFPQINNAAQHEKMVKNLQLAVEKNIQKTYVGELHAEMDRLYATWDQFPAAPPAGRKDVPLEDQLVGNLLKLLQIKLSNTQTQTVASN
jgi:hypothetical protein